MKGLMLVIFIGIGIYMFTNFETKPSLAAGFIVKDADQLKIATLADCVEENNKTVCMDAIYYRCNNQTKKAGGNTIQCNNLTFSISSVKLRKSEFERGWQDPRDVDWIKEE